MLAPGLDGLVAHFLTGHRLNQSESTIFVSSSYFFLLKDLSLQNLFVLLCHCILFLIFNRYKTQNVDVPCLGAYAISEIQFKIVFPRINLIFFTKSLMCHKIHF